jgi:hypothetical protein
MYTEVWSGNLKGKDLVNGLDDIIKTDLNGFIWLRTGRGLQFVDSCEHGNETFASLIGGDSLD